MLLFAKGYCRKARSSEARLLFCNIKSSANGSIYLHKVSNI